VQITGVRVLQNRKHLVTQVIVSFSGAVNASEAVDQSIFELTVAGKKNSFTAKNAQHLSLGSLVYNSSTDAVTLTARKPFALTKSVELVVHGTPPGGLQDSLGGFIDGNDDGIGGDDGEFVIARRGVSGA
jgi:hypothetical protein